jgi:hypothetical protein
MKQDNEQFCVLPCLALAQSCLQLRREYLPICRTAPVTIDWADVPGYMEAFYPTSGSTVQHIDHAPRSITIAIGMDNVSISLYYAGKVEIDLLPLLKIGRANPAFSCNVIHALPSTTASGADHQKISTLERRYLKAENAMIHAFMQCSNETWVKDVTSGNICKAMMSVIGTEQQPQATIYVSETLLEAFRKTQVADGAYGDNYVPHPVEFEEFYLDKSDLYDVFNLTQEGRIPCSIRTVKL